MTIFKCRMTNSNIKKKKKKKLNINFISLNNYIYITFFCIISYSRDALFNDKKGLLYNTLISLNFELYILILFPVLSECIKTNILSSFPLIFEK